MINRLKIIKKLNDLKNRNRKRTFLFLIVCFVLVLLLETLQVPSALAAPASQAQSGQQHVTRASSSPMDCTTNFTIDCLDIMLHPPTTVNSTVQNPISPAFVLLFYTPLDITANNTQVINIWNASLTIVNIFVVVVIMLNGLSLIVSGTVFRYARAIETMPGILLGLIAANCSLVFIRFFIGLNSLFCIDIYAWASTVQKVPDNGFLDRLQLAPGSLNFDNLSLQDIINSFGNIIPLIKDVLSVMLLGQIVIRLFFIVLYIILGPIGLASWGLPGKAGQGLTRLWFSGFISTVTSQSVQVIAIIIVEFSLGPVLRIFSVQISGNVIDPGLLEDVVHIAFLWFIIQVPSVFETAPARAIVEIGSAMSEAVGAVIGSQIALQQSLGQGFVTAAGMGVSMGTRALRRGRSGTDDQERRATDPRRRGTGDVRTRRAGGAGDVRTRRVGEMGSSHERTPHSNRQRQPLEASSAQNAFSELGRPSGVNMGRSTGSAGANASPGTARTTGNASLDQARQPQNAKGSAKSGSPRRRPEENLEENADAASKASLAQFYEQAESAADEFFEDF